LNNLKKILLIVLLLIATLQVNAYSYPANLQQLLVQFQVENEKIEIITIPDSIYRGTILLCRDDYIVFRTINEDVIIIPIGVISENTLL